MKKGALYCKSVALRGLPKFIRDLGGSPERLFSDAELNMSHTKRGDNFYDWSKACNLLERAAIELNEPSLGIKFAYEIYKDGLNSGPTLLFGALTRTMKDFATLASSYQRLHTNGVEYIYNVNEAKNDLEYEIKIHPFSPPCRQFIEHIMAFCFLIERHYVGEANFTKLMFQHNEPEDLSWHKKTFQCELLFNADKTAAYTHKSILDVKLGGNLIHMQPIVKMHLNRKLKNNARYQNTMSKTIEQMLPTIFGARKSNQTDMAKILHLSPKKLQRLLNEEGTTYSKILESVRQSLAERLLFESDISITHLAKLLDYSSNEAFNTACQRWFGNSPRQYRQKLRSPVDKGG